MHFLWICWFELDAKQRRCGIHARQMPRVKFINQDDSEAFGFLDPSNVIRAVYLIPAFSSGLTTSILGPSIAQQAVDNNEDWSAYYVCMYTDCISLHE
jgi:hypothetical protein